MLEMSAFRIPVPWSIYIINSVDKTKLFINPLTPRSSDQYINSPHNFNDMSVSQALRMKIIISLRDDLYTTPNSRDYPVKKSMVLHVLTCRRMNINFSILGIKGLPLNPSTPELAIIDK